MLLPVVGRQHDPVAIRVVQVDRARDGVVLERERHPASAHLGLSWPCSRSKARGSTEIATWSRDSSFMEKAWSAAIAAVIGRWTEDPPGFGRKRRGAPLPAADRTGWTQYVDVQSLPVLAELPYSAASTWIWSYACTRRVHICQVRPASDPRLTSTCRGLDCKRQHVARHPAQGGSLIPCRAEPRRGRRAIPSTRKLLVGQRTRADRLQDHDGNPPRGPPLVIPEPWRDRDPVGPDALSLLALRLACSPLSTRPGDARLSREQLSGSRLHQTRHPGGAASGGGQMLV